MKPTGRHVRWASRMRTSIAVLGMTLLLSACSLLDMRRSVSDSDLASTKTVGVVSVLGDTFHGVSIGTTVFNNAFFDAEIPDWGVDRFATDTAIAALASNSKLSARAINRQGIASSRLDAARQELFDLAARQGFTRIVLIAPAVSENYAMFKPGFGLFERSLLGMGKRCVYAAFMVALYDVPSRSRLAWYWGGDEPCRVGADSDIPFKAEFDSYTPAEKAIIRRRLEHRLQVATKQALRDLDLIPPAGGTR